MLHYVNFATFRGYFIIRTCNQYYLHGHSSTEHGSHCKVATMTWVTGSHHVLGIKDLLSQLWNSEGTVLLGSTRCQRGESRHEEVETGEGDLVDSQLTEISIELTWEAEAGGDS